MCDGSQFLCVNRTSIHYPRRCGCLETLPLWVYRLYSRNRLSVERSNLLSNTLMTTRDTAVVLKIVIGGVRYRAQKRRQLKTYGREAKATRMKNDIHFLGVVLTPQSGWIKIRLSVIQKYLREKSVASWPKRSNRCCQTSQNLKYYGLLWPKLVNANQG